MQAFIARENIKLFECRLAETRDPAEREHLAALIEAQRDRLRELEEPRRDS